MTKTYFNRNAGSYAMSRASLADSQKAIDGLVKQEQQAAANSKGDSLVTLIIHADWTAAFVVVLAYAMIQMIAG